MPVDLILLLPLGAAVATTVARATLLRRRREAAVSADEQHVTGATSPVGTAQTPGTTRLERLERFLARHRLRALDLSRLPGLARFADPWPEAQPALSPVEQLNQLRRDAAGEPRGDAPPVPAYPIGVVHKPRTGNGRSRGRGANAGGPRRQAGSGSGRSLAMSLPPTTATSFLLNATQAHAAAIHRLTSLGVTGQAATRDWLGRWSLAPVRSRVTDRVVALVIVAVFALILVAALPAIAPGGGPGPGGPGRGGSPLAGGVDAMTGAPGGVAAVQPATATPTALPARPTATPTRGVAETAVETTPTATPPSDPTPQSTPRPTPEPPPPPTPMPTPTPAPTPTPSPTPTPVPVPHAGFTYDAHGCFLGTPRVDFTNTSTNATSYFWRFGDGITSTAENPSHFYLFPGEYTVRLEASGPGGKDTTARDIRVCS